MNKSTLILSALAISSGVALVAMEGIVPQPGWVAGDFHQHTLHTDGSYKMADVFANCNAYGLDWWANSEHGGSLRWKDIGAFVPTWKTTLNNSWSEVLAGRLAYPDKVIVQGYEWNMPGHEHCSMGCIANQFDLMPPNAYPVAEFEYRFDASDSDTSGGPEGIWTGKNTVNNHAKAVQAAQWLNDNFPLTSWLVPAHPERVKSYNISHFRDLNNAAPSVCFGFESMPGHQRDAGRGGYSTGANGGGTYGGCGFFAAQVGGLWDTLLGEGRHFWLFASSDFHSTGGDYWPGQYQKTYTYVADKKNPQAIVDGLRSGNSFVTEGDLVKAFEFGAVCNGKTAVMGQDLELQLGTGFFRIPTVTVQIEFQSPAANNAPAPMNSQPRVDHVDIIAGQIGGMVAPGTANYNFGTNTTTKVVARFYNPDSGKSPQWTVDQISGRSVITFNTRIGKSTYFRVRGTNKIIGTDTLDIDVNGNPLLDNVNPASGDAEAWADLWFYSNPIFVYTNVKQ